MDKKEILRELSEKMTKGEITREDLMSYVGPVASDSQEEDKENKKWFASFSVNKLLYVLGTVIAIIGIIAFVAQIWDDIGSLGRVLITLGFGFLMALIGSVLLREKPGTSIGEIFHIVGGVLIPGGVMVFLSEFDLIRESMWPVALAFAVVFVFYLLLNFVYKNPILTFFTIANGTIFIYALLGAILENSYYRYKEDLFAYLTMFVGLAYLLLARSFWEGWNEKLVGVLYFFGSAGFLAAAFSQVFDSLLWQLIYFLVVIGGLFLSVYINSRSVLAVSTIFLLAHISYITSEYFADSIGWPVSLVILGFVFIGLGYGSVTIGRKYIKED